MSYLLARLRLWAAHHRVIWWTCAVAFAGLTGITVRATIHVAPCPAIAETDPDGPIGDERGVALGRGPDPLPVGRAWACGPVWCRGSRRRRRTAPRRTEGREFLLHQALGGRYSRLNGAVLAPTRLPPR